MVTGNLIPQTKPDIGDCVCLLLLTGLGVGLGRPRVYPPRYLPCHDSINTGGRCQRLSIGEHAIYTLCPDTCDNTSTVISIAD